MDSDDAKTASQPTSPSADSDILNIDAESPFHSSDSSSTSSEPVAQISPTERIRELMAIDADVTKILLTASEAIRTLTSTTAPQDGQTTLEATQKAFESKTVDYTVIAQSVTARLRRQIYALEEADIIPRKVIKPQAVLKPQQAVRQPFRLSQAPVPQKQDLPMVITNFGLGKLDVGYLNSRIDTVGKQKEAELWAQARKLLEGIAGGNRHEDGQGGDGMEVDTDAEDKKT